MQGDCDAQMIYLVPLQVIMLHAVCAMSRTCEIGTLKLTISVCLCDVTPNVAQVHSILEHLTRGSVVGVGGQVLNSPLCHSFMCCVSKCCCAYVVGFVFRCECAVNIQSQW